jgi:predicted small lipoprotein YifL
LIILLIAFSGCGRKGDLTPDSLETSQKDSYPKQYPIYKEQVVR